MSCKTAAQARGEAKMSSVPCPLDADRPEAKRINIGSEAPPTKWRWYMDLCNASAGGGRRSRSSNHRRSTRSRKQ